MDIRKMPQIPGTEYEKMPYEDLPIFVTLSRAEAQHLADGLYLAERHHQGCGAGGIMSRDGAELVAAAIRAIDGVLKSAPAQPGEDS